MSTHAHMYTRTHVHMYTCTHTHTHTHTHTLTNIQDDREARRMRRKKMRKLQKTLAVELDLLLPRLGANSKSYKWAGRRSVGRTGRCHVLACVSTCMHTCNTTYVYIRVRAHDGGDAGGHGQQKAIMVQQKQHA